MPGKRRFGEDNDNLRQNSKVRQRLQAAAARRTGGFNQGKFAVPGGKVSGGGLSRAANAGPATSPLAAKRSAFINAATARTGGPRARNSSDPALGQVKPGGTNFTITDGKPGNIPGRGNKFLPRK